jgi:hypothetical protein
MESAKHPWLSLIVLGLAPLIPQLRRLIHDVFTNAASPPYVPSTR